LGKGEEGHGRDFLKYTFFDHFGLVNVFWKVKLKRKMQILIWSAI
jgi:hypothetical protein